MEKILAVMRPFFSSSEEIEIIICKRKKQIEEEVIKVSHKSQTQCSSIKIDKTSEQNESILKDIQKYYDIIECAEKCVSLQKILDRNSFAEYRSSLESLLK